MFPLALLPRGPPGYCGGMKQLPESYASYLEGKDESFIATVRPILQQSTAGQINGVRVVLEPHVVQAHIDEGLPFGTIVESVD